MCVHFINQMILVCRTQPVFIPDAHGTSSYRKIDGKHITHIELIMKRAEMDNTLRIPETEHLIISLSVPGTKKCSYKR